MPKRAGVRIEIDMDARLLRYYERELEAQLMNRPPHEQTVKRLQKRVERYKHKIEGHHQRIESIFK